MCCWFDIRMRFSAGAWAPSAADVNSHCDQHHHHSPVRRCICPGALHAFPSPLSSVSPDPMAGTNDFDSVVTDDGILSSIFGWLAAKDVAGLVFVNKRWSRVALEGTVHTPLPEGVAGALKSAKNAEGRVASEGGEPGPLSRFKAYCGLSVFNLLLDPYFNANPVRFPIDAFVQCPWVLTKMGSLGAFISIHPDNQLPGTLGEVGGLRSVAPSWAVRFKNPDDIIHRVIRPQGNKLVQWTQVLDLTKALAERGFTHDAVGAVLDECPPFRLSVWVAPRCPSETKIDVAFHTPGKTFPMYNTPQMDAYTRGSLFCKTFTIPSTAIDVWEQHAWVLKGYPKGMRLVTVSFSTTPSTETDSREIAFFGSPCLMVVNDCASKAAAGGP